MGGNKDVMSGMQEESATVHVTKIVNNIKTELHLCQSCAVEGGPELVFTHIHK